MVAFFGDDTYLDVVPVRFGVAADWAPRPRGPPGDAVVVHDLPGLVMALEAFVAELRARLRGLARRWPRLWAGRSPFASDAALLAAFES